MMIIATILIFVGLLLLLVLVHEFGHYAAAKRAGCTVEEFGFGFPPRLISRKWKGTNFSFNLFPLGGFVKIKGEDMNETKPAADSFGSKSAGWRIFILSAGVIMNMILAIVFLGVQAGIGTPTLVTAENSQQLANRQTYIVDVTSASPAADAGIKEFDRIVSINSISSPTIEDIQRVASAKNGQLIPFVIDRQGVRHELMLVPRPVPPPGEGPLGIGIAETGLLRVPWWQAPWQGLVRTVQLTAMIFVQFGLIINQVFQSGSVGDSLSGPVGIAIYTREAASLGLAYILEFTALISINLAIINILPIPALDGGRILFVLVEKIRGRRLSGNVEKMTHLIGFALLILLMLAITFKDVNRFI